MQQTIARSASPLLSPELVEDGRNAYEDYLHINLPDEPVIGTEWMARLSDGERLNWILNALDDRLDRLRYHPAGGEEFLLLLVERMALHLHSLGTTDMVTEGRHWTMTTDGTNYAANHPLLSRTLVADNPWLLALLIAGAVRHMNSVLQPPDRAPVDWTVEHESALDKARLSSWHSLRR